LVFTAERREACALQELSGVRLRLCASCQLRDIHIALAGGKARRRRRGPVEDPWWQRDARLLRVEYEDFPRRRLLSFTAFPFIAACLRVLRFSLNSRICRQTARYSSARVARRSLATPNDWMWQDSTCLHKSRFARNELRSSNILSHRHRIRKCVTTYS
jgi:hypothetical protein